MEALHCSDKQKNVPNLVKVLMVCVTGDVLYRAVDKLH